MRKLNCHNPYHNKVLVTYFKTSCFLLEFTYLKLDTQVSCTMCGEGSAYEYGVLVYKLLMMTRSCISVLGTY